MPNRSSFLTDTALYAVKAAQLQIYLQQAQLGGLIY